MRETFCHDLAAYRNPTPIKPAIAGILFLQCMPDSAIVDAWQLKRNAWCFCADLGRIRMRMEPAPRLAMVAPIFLSWNPGILRSLGSISPASLASCRLMPIAVPTNASSASRGRRSYGQNRISRTRSETVAKIALIWHNAGTWRDLVGSQI